MKIGIVTVPDSANFGSFLQAYALAEVLEEWGNDVFFIRTRKKDYLDKLYVNWRPGKRDLKHPFQFIRKNLNGRKKRMKFQEAQSCFKILDSYNEEPLDLVILGSDEIWNVCTKAFQNPLFYGRGMKPAVAFAVSTGKAHYQDFLQYPDLIEDIRNVDEIFVRDKKTMGIVETITHSTPEMVCDPTFLFSKNLLKTEYSDRYLDKNRFLAVYIYPRFLSKPAIHQIKMYAKQKQLKLVSVGFWNEWCDYNITCSPLEFQSVLEKAECVITGTFHGTIFSVLNQKNFISIAMSDKVVDLLGQLQLSDRCIDSEMISKNILEQKLSTECIEYEKTMRQIEKMKESSLSALKGVISRYAR